MLSRIIDAPGKYFALHGANYIFPNFKKHLFVIRKNKFLYISFNKYLVDDLISFE